MNELKVNVYLVLSECVQEGIEAGWNRAHKHTDTPSEQTIKGEIERYIMLNISEKFIFPEVL